MSIVALHICLTLSCSHSEHLGLSNQPIALACYTHIAFLLTKKLSMDEHQSQGWPNELHSGSKRAWPYCYNWIVQSVTDELLFTRAVSANSRSYHSGQIDSCKMSHSTMSFYTHRQCSHSYYQNHTNPFCLRSSIQSLEIEDTKSEYFGELVLKLEDFVFIFPLFT